MAVKRIGGRRVLASDSAVTGDEPITFQAEGLEVTIHFADNSSGQPETSLKGEGQQLEVTLTNWTNPLGLAVQSTIGKVGERPLVLGLYVHSIGEKRENRYRLVNLTLSVEEASQ